MGCVYRSTHGTHRINAYTLCVTRLRFSIHTRSANIYGIYCFHIFLSLNMCIVVFELNRPHRGKYRNSTEHFLFPVLFEGPKHLPCVW